jgi:nickel/cobalt transporter (NiCoT) family protein
MKPSDLKLRLVGICTLVAALNIGAWLWALAAFGARPELLALSLMIYGLGLRHAIDADHIAAIDNVTRKFIQEGKRAVSVGFFFAIGHSVVVICVVIIVFRTSGVLARFERFRDIGDEISTGVSALFLFAIAAINGVIFVSIYRSYRRLRRGRAYDPGDLDKLLNGRGILSKAFRPLFRLISKSSQMFFLGFLFGLGFDTATEIAMFTVSASQSSKGLSFSWILVFPVLFAAGMSLVDTTDGVMMLGAYDWAFARPARRLYYNMAITLLSVTMALLIGSIEVTGLISRKIPLGAVADGVVASLVGNSNYLGVFITAAALGAWLVSYIVYRARSDNAAGSSLG